MNAPSSIDGKKRVTIRGVSPEIENGRYPYKRVIGEQVAVEADIFTDGHDQLSAMVQFRRSGAKRWSRVPMEPLVNDRWRGTFEVHDLGFYEYTLSAWVDHFKTWRSDLRKRLQAGQDVSVEVLVGAGLIEQAIDRARTADSKPMREWVKQLRSDGPLGDKISLVLDDELNATVARYPDKALIVEYPRTLQVQVDPVRARFSTWYEMFPRSAAPTPERHGTFKDVEARLPYLAELGFDVLYFPPIHPIGETKRKGPNNTLEPSPGDPGSPWAIGGAEGGHKAIHPELGTLRDFKRLLGKAREHGIEIALDIAFQCSPDHPYVKEHPEWFSHRPDGTVQFAENPPKKYEDIYPFNFESDDWPALWEELKDIFAYWCKQGVRVFRVDNPHTKPFKLWDWIIGEIKKDYPETIFLAEAFTRPKIMYRLAKGGFNQSYTYFTWRNQKWDLTGYMEQLTQTEVSHFFRPNFWPNTPDILNEYLVHGGRPAFLVRYALAATLTANMGIYGPAFELLENTPREPGSEEYLSSEKYQLRQWDLDRPDSLRHFIALINRIRRENPALHSNETLSFHAADNEQIVCYSKTAEDGNTILCAVNLDCFNTQWSWVHLDLDALGIRADEPFQAHDLLSDARYTWHGAHNYVELNPWIMPVHIFRLRQRARNEHDFEYFM